VGKTAKYDITAVHMPMVSHQELQ